MRFRSTDNHDQLTNIAHCVEFERMADCSVGCILYIWDVENKLLILPHTNIKTVLNILCMGHYLSLKKNLRVIAYN